MPGTDLFDDLKGGHGDHSCPDGGLDLGRLATLEKSVIRSSDRLVVGVFMQDAKDRNGSRGRGSDRGPGFAGFGVGPRICLLK